MLNQNKSEACSYELTIVRLYVLHSNEQALHFRFPQTNTGSFRVDKFFSYTGIQGGRKRKLMKKKK